MIKLIGLNENLKNVNESNKLNDIEEKIDNAIGIILAGLDDSITGEYDPIDEDDNTITLRFYSNNDYLGLWEIDIDDIDNINLLDSISAEVDASYSGLEHNELDEIKESMDGKDATQKIDYIKDALEELQYYLNTNGAIPDDIGNLLNNMYNLADNIYEFSNKINESTSGISADAYSIKSIDILPSKKNTK